MHGHMTSKSKQYWYYY